MGIYIDFLESSKGVTSNTLAVDAGQEENGQEYIR